MMMDIQPVTDEASYDWALREIEAYFDNEPEDGTPEAARFDVLAALIAAYGAKTHPVPSADPLDVLLLVMEQTGRSQTDLAILFGSRSRASEVLAGRRSLSLDQIARLSRGWGIPADALLPSTVPA